MKNNKIMNELTNELKEPSHDLKERFFMQYYMQQVQWNENGNTPMLVTGRHIYRTSYLSLRPLSSITEEEFKVMVRRNYPKDVDDIFFDKQFICDLFEDKEHLEHDSLRIGMVIFDVDYLRSIRIALPFMGIPVEQWIEWGVVKLKEACL